MKYFWMALLVLEIHALLFLVIPFVAGCGATVGAGPAAEKTPPRFETEVSQHVETYYASVLVTIFKDTKTSRRYMIAHGNHEVSLIELRD
jgi:hypothetical protein